MPRRIWETGSRTRTRLTQNQNEDPLLKGKKIIEKIKKITEPVKESPKNADSKIHSALLVIPPIIKDPGIFDKPKFLQLLRRNFPEITNPESFKETLKELYLSFINLEEPDQRSNLRLKLQQLMLQTQPKHTMPNYYSSPSSSGSDSESDSEPEDDFRRLLINFCRGLSELLNRDRASSDSESDHSSSSGSDSESESEPEDDFRRLLINFFQEFSQSLNRDRASSVTPESYSPLLRQQYTQQPMP